MPEGQLGAVNESALAPGPPPWYQSLQFKLAALCVLLIVALVSGAVMFSKLLVGDQLNGETFRYERESGTRLALEFNGAAERAQTLAATLARLAAAHPSAPQLAELVPGAGMIAAIGIWPEPDSAGGARSSQLWLRDASGAWQPREDYNDTRTVLYSHEKWYTPARYIQKNRCYWTPLYRDLLLKRDVITCSLPMQAAQGFAGVVTVSLAIDALQAGFNKATAGDTGYSLLLDGDNRLLAVSAGASKLGGATRPRNLAELGQMQPALNPVAIALNQQQDAAIGAAQSAGYGAAQAAALSRGTREMSNAEAATALAQIAVSNVKAANAEPQQLRIADDPVLGDDAHATVFPLPAGRWHLLRVSPLNQGFAGANHLYDQALLVNTGAVVLTLLLAFAGLRLLLIQPLRRMAAQIADSGDALDERPHNELGAIARGYNQRSRQLREISEHANTSSALLTQESGERRNAEDALARVQERTALALQSVADGVISTDAQGRVEDMNPIAEQLTGLALSAGRGKAFNEIFNARGKGDVVMPNLALMVVQRGTRLDYTEGLRLISLAGHAHDVQLTVTPIRTRQNRITGAVVVFRRGGAPMHAQLAPVIEERISLDPGTGLATRAALNQRLRGLLDASRGPRNHALLLMGIDGLKRINDSGGPQAGDEAIIKLGGVLAAQTGKAGEVFRLSGDHYAVLLENHDRERALALAEALRAAVGRTRLEWEGQRFDATASFGVVVFDNRTINPAQVIQHAELACSAAKRAGRNRTLLWHEGLDAERPLDDSIWVRRIRDGLDKNLFHLTTQLIRSSPLHRGEGDVFEVLVTLEDEEGFWSTAATFVPIAERHQMMPELDRWVISHTISHLAQHPELSDQLSFVTINLSGSSLANHSVLEHIVQTFERTPSVHAHRVCFEISEGTATSQPQQAQMFCEAMRGLGCRMSVDHFSGHRISEVSLLRRLPLDYVKVDSTRFRNIVNDEVEQMMAESLVRLARTLQKRVIIANLEDNARLEIWKRLGADYFQGHIVAKPTPVIFSAAA
jgi:diguanylate cyclase (GGDEF)-like protein/PAS domain S-box-containing protein